MAKAEILIAMESLVDKDAEIKRLCEMKKKLEGVIAGIEKRLGNEAFTSKAPQNIIDGARAQLELNQSQLDKVLKQLEELSRL